MGTRDIAQYTTVYLEIEGVDLGDILVMDLCCVPRIGEEVYLGAISSYFTGDYDKNEYPDEFYDSVNGEYIVIGVHHTLTPCENDAVVTITLKEVESSSGGVA